jgi:hypothetical protein
MRRLCRGAWPLEQLAVEVGGAETKECEAKDQAASRLPHPSMPASVGKEDLGM